MSPPSGAARRRGRRSQKPAYPEAEVLDYLTGLRGRQFDPRLLDAFFDLLPEIRRIRSLHPDAASD